MVKVTCTDTVLICFSEDAEVTLTSGEVKVAAALLPDDMFVYQPMGVKTVATVESY